MYIWSAVIQTCNSVYQVLAQKMELCKIQVEIQISVF